MRGEGLTYAQIGEALSVNASTAHRWVMPRSAAKNLVTQRERRNGGPLEDRECEGYGCHTVITAAEPTHKRHCSAACRARATRMRRTAMA